MNVKIKSTVKTLDIEWPNGKKQKITFMVGNPEIIKGWAEKAESIKGLASKVTEDNALESMMEAEKDVIELVAGKAEWKRIYKRANKNVFAILDIVVAISKLMQEGIADNAR